MPRTMIATIAVIVALLALPQSARAQTLQTAPPNNGSGGVFMELTALGTALNVTRFDVPFGGTIGTFATVEVWTRPGSYAGFTANSAGWTLTQTLQAERLGAAVWAPVALTNPIFLATGQTTSVYLQETSGPAGAGIRYTGTAAAPPQTFWSNADISLFSDTARTGSIPFGGTAFTPRTFSGVVHYSPVVIPEPSVL